MTREEAIQWLSDALTSPIIYGDYAVALCMAIEALQAEPKHGEWIEHEGYDECNLCHVYTTFGSNFCPNCGAKMDKWGDSE